MFHVNLPGCTRSISSFQKRPQDQRHSPSLRRPHIAASAASRLPGRWDEKRSFYDNKKLYTEVEGDVSYVVNDVCIDNIYIYENVYVCACVSILKTPSPNLYCFLRVKQINILTSILPSGSIL